MTLKCRICKEQSLKKFLSLGKMPVANAFLKKEDLKKKEYTYNLEVGFCEKCKMVQLIDIVPYEKYIIPDENKKTHYAFFSSTSKFMERHFAELVGHVEKTFLDKDSKVLEIGSNDGIMLKTFKKNSVIGVEPSSNVAEVAIKQGIETIIDFFSKELAEKIFKKRGKFKAILSTNVTLNIIDIHSMMEGVKLLLEDKGVFITEDPYIVDILEKSSYDQIYDEHIWYFSVTSFSNLLKMHDLEIFDAERLWVHGGSMRIFVCKKGAYEKTRRLEGYLKLEEEKKIDSITSYLDFARSVEKSKKDLVALLKKLKSEGKRIVVYAASSKSTIILNYCNIGSQLIDYISDSTPTKQGLFSPGKHIPIVSPEVFHKDRVNYAFLGAWNHAKEIMEKEKIFLERGGRFIVHVPEIKILGDNAF